MLRNLNCITDNERLTNVGILMFAKDIDFILNHATVTCVLYQEDDKVKIVDRKDFKRDLLNNIDDALAFLKQHSQTKYVISGAGPRKEISEYPEEALREAVINAVCHRDYFQRGSHVMIEIYSNRLEISNPGGLPKGLTKKNFGKLSIARNPLLADMLHRARYVEKVGSGISRIKDAVQSYDGAVKFKIQYDDFYVITLYKTVVKARASNVKNPFRRLLQKTNPGVARSKLPQNYRKTTAILPQNYRKTVELITQNPDITVKQLAIKLKMSPDGVRYQLKYLKKNKIIKRQGSNRSGYWRVVDKRSR